MFVCVEQVLSLETDELADKMDTVEFCMVLLQIHDLLDGLPDVKSRDVDSEVV